MSAWPVSKVTPPAAGMAGRHGLPLGWAAKREQGAAAWSPWDTQAHERHPRATPRRCWRRVRLCSFSVVLFVAQVQPPFATPVVPCAAASCTASTCCPALRPPLVAPLAAQLSWKGGPPFPTCLRRRRAGSARRRQHTPAGTYGSPPDTELQAAQGLPSTRATPPQLRPQQTNVLPQGAACAQAAGCTPYLVETGATPATWWR